MSNIYIYILFNNFIINFYLDNDDKKNTLVR